MKKCDLYSANAFRFLQNGSKSSKREKHCVEAVQITSYCQIRVVVYWFWIHPCDNPQWQQGKNIDNEDKEIESIPTVSAMKTKENTRMVKANLKKNTLT